MKQKIVEWILGRIKNVKIPVEFFKRFLVNPGFIHQTLGMKCRRLLKIFQEISCAIWNTLILSSLLFFIFIFLNMFTIDPLMFQLRNLIQESGFVMVSLAGAFSFIFFNILWKTEGFLCFLQKNFEELFASSKCLVVINKNIQPLNIKPTIVQSYEPPQGKFTKPQPSSTVTCELVLCCTSISPPLTSGWCLIHTPFRKRTSLSWL